MGRPVCGLELKTSIKISLMSYHLAGELIEQVLPPRPGRRHVADDDAVEEEHHE